MKLNKLKNSFIPLFLLLLVFLFCVGGLLEFGKANQLNHPQKGNSNENQTDVNQGNGSSSNSEENSDASENSGKDKNTNEDMNTTDGSNESTSVVNSRIQELIDTMTLEEKVGQLFFVRCDESTAVEDVSKYNLG